MLYELISYLDQQFSPAGFGAFEFITTRTAFAAATALIISLLIGRKIIEWLERMQLQETIRDDIGLDAHLAKGKTPTMGGVIIILATAIPALLWMSMDSIYTWMSIFVMVVLGLVGFVDD